MATKPKTSTVLHSDLTLMAPPERKKPGPKSKAKTAAPSPSTFLGRELFAPNKDLLGYAKGGPVGPVSINITSSVAPVNIDDVITAVQENILAKLEGMRAAIEIAQRKNIGDVREFGDTQAGSLLLGVEEKVSYYDLCKLVRSMKDGIAGRRVARGGA